MLVDVEVLDDVVEVEVVNSRVVGGRVVEVVVLADVVVERDVTVVNEGLALEVVVVEPMVEARRFSGPNS
ncbi:MAG TPA: hypothetical protein ENH13_07170 [Euryarchaeota archaeon]|nr:hypothetical protein [Euryarchaeota archaeon]